ncbi:MAG: OmpA family protein [Croceitalea sp.]|nr:OmpA family protein [Croceitalea sp.]
MKCSIYTFIILFTFCFSSAQEKKSKGDNLFFQYDYKAAALAYESDLKKGNQLSSKQFLNLADAYYKLEMYDKATDVYMDVYVNDTIMDNFHFNKLLVGLTKIDRTTEAKKLFDKRGARMPDELQENVFFNNDLLESENITDVLEFKIFNLESNSPHSDFAPTFYNENLLFTSGRPSEDKSIYLPSGESFLEIYETRKNENGEIYGALPFSKIEKSAFHKATPYYAKELNSIFYILSNTEEGELDFDEKGKNALAIGVQEIDQDFRFVWKDLSTSFYYPFYDSESNRLYFAADLKDGYGGTDIYYVNTNKGNIMSAPINLGPRINSPANEISPFIFENSLYFASDVFYGFGGMDIYKANFKKTLDFSIPVNLGNQINSVADDFGLIIKSEGNGYIGYFASNRDGGKGNDDIYGFVVDRKPGLRTLTLNGSIINPNTRFQPIEGAIVRITDADGTVIKEVYSDAQGNYRLEIPWKDGVSVESSKEGYSVYNASFDENELEQLEKIKLDIDLYQFEDLVEEKEDRTVVKLRKFYFDRGKTEITQDISVELDKVVDMVNRFPKLQIGIETYTDSRGSSASNLKISQDRSDAIKKYLVKNGVPQTNIVSSLGFGEEKILNNCENGVFCIEVLHMQNQRSLLVVLNDNILFD